MNYVDEIFMRSNLQSLREFLLHGAEDETPGPDPNNYKRRIDEAWQVVDELLRQNIPDKNEYERMANRIHHYASVHQDVYMEIGLKCAAKLAAQWFS